MSWQNQVNIELIDQNPTMSEVSSAKEQTGNWLTLSCQLSRPGPDFSIDINNPRSLELCRIKLLDKFTTSLAHYQ